jgi:hypothetical protein
MGFHDAQTPEDIPIYRRPGSAGDFDIEEADDLDDEEDDDSDLFDQDDDAESELDDADDGES